MYQPYSSLSLACLTNPNTSGMVVVQFEVDSVICRTQCLLPLTLMDKAHLERCKNVIWACHAFEDRCEKSSLGFVLMAPSNILVAVIIFQSLIRERVSVRAPWLKNKLRFSTFVGGRTLIRWATEFNTDSVSSCSLLPCWAAGKIRLLSRQTRWTHHRLWSVERQNGIVQVIVDFLRSVVVKSLDVIKDNEKGFLHLPFEVSALKVQGIRPQCAFWSIHAESRHVHLYNYFTLRWEICSSASKN